MKKYIAFLPCVVSYFTGLGQTYTPNQPQNLNCLQPFIYTHPSFPGSYSVAREFSNVTCIEFNETTAPGNLIKEGKTNVIAGESIHFTGTMHIGDFSAAPPVPIGGGVTVPAQFHAFIGNNDFEAAWFEPSSTVGQVGQYEKLELGIILPDSLGAQIQRFVDSSANPNQVNPFDPQQVSFEADFYYLNNEFTALNKPVYKKVYGFYYEEYIEPNRTFDISNKNYWVPDSNFHKVRFRWAPDQIGNWVVKLKIITPSQTFQALPINFECVSSSNDGFVEVSPYNFRYLMKGDETFFPIGTNLPHPTCFDCKGDGRDGGELYNYNGSSPKAYATYHQELETLKNNGGNYFRMLISPATVDVEFEKLGNYSARMSNAWEMDRILDKCKALDMYMHLNLQFHYTLEVPSYYYMWAWDWKPNSLNDIDPMHLAYSDKPWYYDGVDSGYCYRRELGLNSPYEFFTNTEAIAHYKNKLRYMISRWGYSTNIGAIELYSEIDNAGATTNFTVEPDTTVLSGYSIKRQSGPKPYWENSPAGLDFVHAISDWNIEMARYIKQDLFHTQHLITQSYTGGATLPSQRRDTVTFNGKHFQPFGADIYEDDTYESSFIDIISWNNYAGVFVYRMEQLATLQIPYRQSTIEKPLMFSEVGSGINRLDITGCDKNSEFIRTIWSTAFSGALGTGLEYNGYSHDKNNDWQYYSILNDFLANNTFGIHEWKSQYDQRPDNEAEVFALVNETTGEEAWGVVVNKNYNARSQAVTGSNCANIFDEEIGGNDYATPENISPEMFQNLKLDMDNGDYMVEWTNARNGNFVGYSFGEVSLSTLNKLTLEYPTLCLHTDCDPEDILPLAAFKVVKLGSRAAVIKDSLEQNQLFSSFVSATPNPTTNVVNITLHTTEQYSLTVFNSAGEQIYNKANCEGTVQLPTSQWENGFYTARITTSTNSYTKKIIKQTE